MLRREMKWGNLHCLKHEPYGCPCRPPPYPIPHCSVSAIQVTAVGQSALEVIMVTVFVLRIICVLMLHFYAFSHGLVCVLMG